MVYWVFEKTLTYHFWHLQDITCYNIIKIFCLRSLTDRIGASGASGGSSILPEDTFFGPIAQLVEHCIRIAEVGSSTLLRSTL